jgi:folate-dependent phosphoribosylglycinamide formyltransferase PurN
MQHRVVILCGPDLIHRNTCATLINAGLNVVGICTADGRTAGLPLRYLARRIQIKGLKHVGSQIAARLMYSSLNRRKDQRLLHQIVDRVRVNSALAQWQGARHRTRNFGAIATVDWLRGLRPDVLVVHTAAIIPPSVLAMPTTGLTIGGHPGLIPQYRGSHSAFWAIARGRPEDVGCSVFLLSEGIDTGAILMQERVEIHPADSFVTLGWRAMVRQAEMQAQIISQLDRGIRPSAQQVPVPNGSYFDNPTLGHYLKYLKLRTCR